MLSHEENMGLNLESSGNLLKIQNGDIALTSLNAAYIRSVEARQLCKLLLRDAEFRSVLSNVITDDPQQVHQWMMLVE